MNRSFDLLKSRLTKRGVSAAHASTAAEIMCDIVGLGAGTAKVGVVTTDQTTHGTSDLMAADITKVNGVAVAQGHGTASTALRVELPTDGTGVVGLAAGSAKIGVVTTDQTTHGTTDLMAADIHEVESKFRDKRSTAFGEAEDVDQVYISFASKAFQCGFVMAIDYLAYSGDGKRLTKCSPFIEKLGEFENKQWDVLFNELWPVIRPGQSTDPKAWPTYRNLLLRMYDTGEQNLYSMENLLDTPDWMLCEKLLARAANAIYEADGEAPDPDVRKKRAKQEVTTAADLLTRSGIAPIWGDKAQPVVKRADTRLEEMIGALLALD